MECQPGRTNAAAWICVSRFSSSKGSTCIVAMGDVTVIVFLILILCVVFGIMHMLVLRLLPSGFISYVLDGIEAMVIIPPSCSFCLIF